MDTLTLTAEDVLAELESMGTAQNRKVYARHGVGENQYGVSYANLNALEKKYKKQHELALELWASGNHDARILASRIADPDQVDSALLEAWVRDLDNYVVTDAFSNIVGKTSLAQEKAEAWIKSRDEWPATAGWNILGGLAMRDKSLPDVYFFNLLTIIERDIHLSKNRARYAMNNVLIAIGIRNLALEEAAVASANRIGTVDVDHGETGCKTPEAVSYIAKTNARKNKKK